MAPKLSKLVGLPQVMDCPHCHTPMEPVHTIAAKARAGAIVAGAAAAAVALPFLAPLAGVAAAEGAARFAWSRKGIYYRCVACGFEHSHEMTRQVAPSSGPPQDEGKET